MDVYLFPAWIWICPYCILVKQGGGFGYLLNFVQAISKAGLSLGGMLMLRSLLEEMLDSWVAGKLVDSTEPMAMTTIFTILYSIIPIETWIELSRTKLSFLTWEDIQNLKLLECLAVNVLVLGFFHKMWYDIAVQLMWYENYFFIILFGTSTFSI